MKNTLRLKIASLIVLSIFVQINLLQAQNTAPEVGTIMYEDKERPCWVAHLDPEPKTLKNAWKDYLQDNHDFKLKGIGLFQNKDLMSAEEVSINVISTKKLNFYTHIVGDENGSEMKVFASYGYDVYIDNEKHATEFAIIKHMFENFIQEYLPKNYGEKIEDLTDQIDDLKGEISSDKNEIEDLQKEIKKLNQRIVENEKALSEAEMKLDAKQQKLKKVESEFKTW